jgi:hypothetical protein
MKQAKRCVRTFVAAAFIGWSHARTDEIPVVLGFILIVSAVVAGVFPQRHWFTRFFIGAPVFLVETFVHFGVIHAPYPPSKGLPWAPASLCR